jgi:hypothetical protein
VLFPCSHDTADETYQQQRNIVIYRYPINSKLKDLLKQINAGSAYCSTFPLQRHHCGHSSFLDVTFEERRIARLPVATNYRLAEGDIYKIKQNLAKSSTRLSLRLFTVAIVDNYGGRQDRATEPCAPGPPAVPRYTDRLQRSINTSVPTRPPFPNAIVHSGNKNGIHIVQPSLQSFNPIYPSEH